MNGVRFKAGVLPLRVLAPAGVRILAAVDVTARVMSRDLTITCACDEHPPSDPHSTGEAFDIRSKDIPQEEKERVLLTIMGQLSDNHGTDALHQKDGGYVTVKFFGWLEHPGQITEHFHIQRRNGTSYP